MLLWQKIKTPLLKLHRLPKRYCLLAGVLVVATLYVVVFRERTLTYSYSGGTCDQRLILLPGVFSQAGSSGYEVTTQGGWSVFGQRLTATSLCVTPVAAPSENSSTIVAYAPWAGWVARLLYRVEVGSHPTVDASVLEKPIPVNRELMLPMSEPDATFSYKMEVDDTQALCEAKSTQLSCDVPSLELRQGSSYVASLEKHFKGEVVDEVISADIETLSPLSITKTSIKKGATVYGKPKSLTIEVDKPIAGAEFSAKRVDGDKPIPLGIDTSVDNKKVTIAFDKELPRRATIEIKAGSFEAVDGSTPLGEYVLRFKTSGGPRVTGSSVGSKIAVGSQIIVTFDQELSSSQDISSMIDTGGGVTFQARQGNRLIFSADKSDRCSDVSITIGSDIESRHGISGQSAWSYSGRTLCQVASVFGQSVQGRPLMAYTFGANGPTTLYVGAIHGNEPSSSGVLRGWIDDLEANPHLYKGKRVVVVPVANPDGIAAGTRDNSRGVNLNRNFPTDNWKTDVNDTDGFKKGGGGKKPLSEPEAKALADLSTQLRPRLMISFHAIGSLVVGDPGGYSARYAAMYASSVGYRDMTYQSSPFDYDTFGGYEDWTFAKQGIPSMIVELGDYVYHNFNHHRAALRAMLQ